MACDSGYPPIERQSIGDQLVTEPPRPVSSPAMLGLEVRFSAIGSVGGVESTAISFKLLENNIDATLSRESAVCLYQFLLGSNAWRKCPSDPSILLCSDPPASCSHCDGRGWIGRYKHIQNGICFDCWGDRFRCPGHDSLAAFFRGYKDVAEIMALRSLIEEVISASLGSARVKMNDEEMSRIRQRRQRKQVR